MNNQEQIKYLIKSTAGQANTLTIPRIYIGLLQGDIPTALLLSQCVYWSDKTKRSDNYFYKSQAEWEEEIGLSKYQVRRATNKLERLGLLETKLIRAHGAPTIHYKINIQMLISLIVKKLDNQETSLSDSEETKHSDSEETALSDSKETAQSLTDTTHEITLNLRDGDNFANCARAYEQNIGPLTPMLGESIGRAIDEYTEGWVIDAIKIAAEKGIRNWSYVEGILKRWHAKGRRDDNKKGYTKISPFER